PPSNTTCPLGIAGLRLAAGLAVLGRFTFFLSSFFFLAPTGLPEAFTFFGPLKLPASSLISRRSNCRRRYRSILDIRLHSWGATRDTASPSAPARPVRPTRCR